MTRRVVTILAILAAVVALAGCGGCGPTAETADWEAKAFCADHGGVDHINFKPYESPLEPAHYDAECVDGSEIE